MKNVGRLYLNNSNLDSIPSEIAHLPTLQVLELGFNRISTIPDYLRSMQLLKVLGLQGNLIRSVARCQFNALIQRVNLSNNRIDDFAPDLAYYDKLVDLNLRYVLVEFSALPLHFVSNIHSYSVATIN